MDAITLLKEDHRTVEKLFKRFEQAGDSAYVEKRQIADRICEELSKHAAIEEMLFYPVTRATVDDIDDVVLESLEEHHIVKWTLSEIDKMDPADERFDAKVTVLIEAVRHHVEEEETEYFPQVRDALGRNALTELGDAMVEAKKTAPTHPHPRSPDTPPGNVVVGNAAGVVDRIGDTVSGLAQGYVAIVQDLVARIRGTRSDAKAPTGSSVARKTAQNVRSAADETIEKVLATAEDARDQGEATAKAAKAGAKGTVTSATKGAEETVTAVKRGASTTKTAAKRSAKGTRTTARKAARTTKTTAKRAATTTARAKASA